MLLIDADWIKSNLNKVFHYECDHLYGTMQLIDEAPTLTPKNEALTIERVAREYLEICGEDCVGDPSVGIPECPFFKYADILDNGALIEPRCELVAYRRPPERQEDT